MRFTDRTDAGRRLAGQLLTLGLRDPVVLALPRGGVPVGAEVAAALSAPFDVFVARKVGAPGRPEYGIGAVAEGGGVVANDEALRALGLSDGEWDALVAQERAEVDRRVLRYRGDRPLPTLRGRDIVVVDDGLATGVTAEAALRALRTYRPRRLVLAAPVCARASAIRLALVADEVACVLSPVDFAAVGQWYDEFAQTEDREVLALLPGGSGTSVAK
jgi:predicted phosphoribosyltransferase